MLTNPLTDLASALYRALDHDLPALEHSRGQRRPHEGDVHVVMFPQTWASTALGFGGIGGQAFTDAYTVVVICDMADRAAVYFGGRFAYLAPLTVRFYKDLRDQDLAACHERGRYSKENNPDG